MVQVLSSLGQSSMLHLKGNRVSPERISRALQTLQVPFRCRLHIDLNFRTSLVSVCCLTVSDCLSVCC